MSSHLVFPDHFTKCTGITVYNYAVQYIFIHLQCDPLYAINDTFALTIGHVLLFYYHQVALCPQYLSFLQN